MVDYNIITESPGLKATSEQLARILQRYQFARQFARDKDVLEVACGTGIGLGYLARIARKIIGGDIDEKNVSIAKNYYQGKKGIKVCLLDAHNLNFPEKSFDLVLLYEAIYYLKNPEKFVLEAKRVLKDNGVLIIGTVNKEWEDFHPSSYTYRYFSVSEIRSLLSKYFSGVEIFGGFPVKNEGIKNKCFSLIKKTASRLNLIPGNLKARTYLKRIFMGKLYPIPQEVNEAMSKYSEPILLGSEVDTRFKIIYGIGKNGKYGRD